MAFMKRVQSGIEVAMLITGNGRFEAFARLAAGAVLVVALPGWRLDVGSTPRRLVSILAVLFVALQLLTRLAARVGVFLVVAVRLTTFLAPRWILVTVLASCTFYLFDLKSTWQRAGSATYMPHSSKNMHIKVIHTN